MKKVVAIYHKDCSDGTSAAAVILRKFPEAHVFPMHHTFTKEDTDPIFSLIDNDTEVYTVDCVIGVKEILALGHKVTSIDHHISVKEEYEKLSQDNPNYTFIFDNNKSGTSLAWSYFFPSLEPTEFVKLVEDYDLWKWQYGDKTRNLQDYLYSIQNHPELFLKYIDNPAEALTKGQIISSYINKLVESSLKSTPLKLSVGSHVVLAYNFSEYKDYICEALSKKNNQAVIGFRIDGQNVRYSLRSHNEHTPSALDLATILGGGGHRNSCGASTTLPEFIKMIIV